MVSGNLTHLADELGTGANSVATFQLDQQAVRGRITRMDGQVTVSYTHQTLPTIVRV